MQEMTETNERLSVQMVTITEMYKAKEKEWKSKNQKRENELSKKAEELDTNKKKITSMKKTAIKLRKEGMQDKEIILNLEEKLKIAPYRTPRSEEKIKKFNLRQINPPVV